MGIGGGIFLIALGAILAYAINIDVQVINLGVAGWVLMLAGATLLMLTIWFWRGRRRRGSDAPTPRDVSILNETRIAHSHAIIDPDMSSTRPLSPPEP